MISKLTSRRGFLATTGISAATIAGIIAVGESGVFAHKAETVPTPTVPSTNNKTLQDLLAGNLRFQTGKAQWPNQTAARRQEVSKKQSPRAIVFGCIDSRMPPELVFDQGLGDLLTIRTAGHVIDSAAMGSIEYGVAEMGIPLLIVMGHERCGAVSATIDAVDKHEHAPGSIQALVDYIRPSVLMAQGQGDVRLDNAIQNNIRRTVQALPWSPIIRDAVKAGKLTIVGTRYDLDTGAVTLIR